MGIEPTLSAWKAEVLPLNYTRKPKNRSCDSRAPQRHEAPVLINSTTGVPGRVNRTTAGGPSAPLARSAAWAVEGGGFEPPKAEPSDLQSDPFGRSGTPPKASRLLWGAKGFLSIQTRARV
jgi:hypothetical protein